MKPPTTPSRWAWNKTTSATATPRRPSRSGRKLRDGMREGCVGSLGEPWGAASQLPQGNLGRKGQLVSAFSDIQPHTGYTSEHAPQVFGRPVKIAHGLVALALRPEQVGELISAQRRRICREQRAEVASQDTTSTTT